MNLDFTLNLHDLETLLTKSNCSCHFINPNKTRILLWREVKTDQTTYHLRIGIQKFNSQEQLDRNGEIYWRFGSNSPDVIKQAEKEGVHSELSQKEAVSTAELSQKEPDPITKFNQRQDQAQAYGKSNHSEQSANNQSEQAN